MGEDCTGHQHWKARWGAARRSCLQVQVEHSPIKFQENLGLPLENMEKLRRVLRNLVSRPGENKLPKTIFVVFY
jgi:hypothetical protein